MITTSSLNSYCVIYLLTNKANGKIYIGQTWMELKTRMGKNGIGYRSSPYIYSAIQKYGVENFEYSILEKCYTQKDADNLESLYINKYNSLDHNIGYNIKDGGSSGRHSDETKQKISISISNKKWSKRALLARSKAGKLWKGKKRGALSLKRKQNISKKMISWHSHNIHPMKYKKHSLETRKRISDSNKGRKRKPESIIKSALANKMDFNKEKSIIEAYLNGNTIQNIEKTFNTSRSSIYRILKRNDIKLINNFSKWSGKFHSEKTKSKMSIARYKYKKECS